MLHTKGLLDNSLNLRGPLRVRGLSCCLAAQFLPSSSGRSLSNVKLVFFIMQPLRALSLLFSVILYTVYIVWFLWLSLPVMLKVFVIRPVEHSFSAHHLFHLLVRSWSSFCQLTLFFLPHSKFLVFQFQCFLNKWFLPPLIKLYLPKFGSP